MYIIKIYFEKRKKTKKNFKFCMKYIHVHPYNVHAASLLDLSVDVNPVDSAVDQRLRLQLLPVQVVYHAVYTACTCSLSVNTLVSRKEFSCPMNAHKVMTPYADWSGDSIR